MCCACEKLLNLMITPYGIYLALMVLCHFVSVVVTMYIGLSLLRFYYSFWKFFLIYLINNPLMAVAAIWRFEVITRAAVCLNPADMYLYAFQCSMRLF